MDEPGEDRGGRSQLREAAAYVVAEALESLAVAVVVITCFAVPMAIGTALADGRGLLVGVLVGIVLSLTAGLSVLRWARARRMHRGAPAG